MTPPLPPSDPPISFSVVIYCISISLPRPSHWLSLFFHPLQNASVHHCRVLVVLTTLYLPGNIFSFFLLSNLLNFLRLTPSLLWLPPSGLICCYQPLISPCAASATRSSLFCPSCSVSLSCLVCLHPVYVSQPVLTIPRMIVRLFVYLTPPLSHFLLPTPFHNQMPFNEQIHISV